MHTVRYMTSHLLAIPFRIMEKTKKLRCTLHMLALLDYVILIVAVTAGLYASFLHTENMMLVLIGGFGMFLFAFSGMLYYYFGRADISSSLTHLWCGCLLGVITFVGEDVRHAIEVPFTVTMAILLTSMAIKIFWSLVQRSCGLVTHTSLLLTHVEIFELLGFSVACMMHSKAMYSMWLMVFACSFTLVAVRLKTFLAIPCLSCFVAISVVSFINSLNLSLNVFALCCFVVRLFVDPIFDLYFNSLSSLERWDVVFNTHRCSRKVVIFLGVVFEVTFLVLAGESTVNHTEWYFAVPAYVVFGFVWVCLHIVLVLTCWTFSNKLTESQQVYRSLRDDSHKSLGMVMAARGMRFFALISRNLVLITFIGTLMLGGVSWQDDNAAFMASWLIVLPLEALMHGMLYELGNTLGGTCTGYAVVGPSAFCRSDGSPVLIPASSIEEVNSRSISLLNTMQRFFNYHMIDAYSCDFSTSGLALGTLKSKMSNFFSRQLPDGPRFDTYLVYYSGHVHPNGDWALADSEIFKFETLLELWEEASMRDSQSRLILVQDTNFAKDWFRRVTSNTNSILAMQTCVLEKSTDPETGRNFSIGDFTHQWVNYNCLEHSISSWNEQESQIKAVYAVSHLWSEFEFHQPTDADVEQHWHQGFPRLVHPFIKRMTILCKLNLVAYCFVCWNCLKRWKMKWLPPQVINTGHGFKLVRS